ncbi:MAG: radical SAM protein [Elusimicrobia bacterium]|nr:radical SAM protein [Elusimicrobiota bacterium]
MALHLPINGVCNIKCVFCSADGRSGDFELASLLDQIDRDKTGHVQISGGDPMVKDPAELLKILLRCRQKNKIIEFQTNGVMVTRYNPKRLKMLVGLVDFFNINFSAHTPELDLAVTETSGAFEWRVAGVRRLLELGASVRLNYIVHEANYRHCEDFVRFAARELPGFSWIQFSYCKGMGRARGEKAVMPRFRDAAPYLNAAMGRCSELGLDFDVDHIPVCFVMDHREHHADYRKMRDFTSGVHLSEKQQVADCKPCAMKDVCPGPRRDYIEIYGAL